jgi:hypothetical protein
MSAWLPPSGVGRVFSEVFKLPGEPFSTSLLQTVNFRDPSKLQGEVEKK